MTVQTPLGLAGLLTIAAALFPMLAKSALPYYLLEPYVFGSVWWIARSRSAVNWRMTVPILLTLDLFLLKWAAGSADLNRDVATGLVSAALLALVVGLVVFDLVSTEATSPRRRQTHLYPVVDS